MRLSDLDLNLLVVFRQLMLDGQVSKSAKALGLSQPAVSNALARLRILLKDELFLRTSRGVTPTPYALSIADAVADALTTLHEAINQRTNFDPKTSERNFCIAMTDIGEIYFLPELLRSLAIHAPRVTISTVRNTTINLRESLETGAVDLAIGLIPELKGEIFQRRLFKQRYVCVLRKTHPLAKKRNLSLKDYESVEHVAVIAAGTGHSIVDEVVSRSGVARRVRLTVPHFVAMGHILAATDLIATVPQALAERIAEPFDLVQLSSPLNVPEIAINMFWHPRAQRDPASKWLRDTLASLFQDKPARATTSG
jgi:DNA-binding transcriptional LysR family regulator